MVVVVGILVILASLAVRSMDGVDQQTRFETTQRTMQNVSDAVLSVGRDADGSSLISGFIADMGRLPRAYGTDPNTQLQELWSNPGKFQPLAVRTPVGPAGDPCDPEVLLATGWRGNYLRLGVGQSNLRDGWGKAFVLSFVGSEMGITSILSLGADGSPGSPVPPGAYDRDVAIQLGAASASPGADPSKAAITGRVFRIDPKTGQVRDPNSAEGKVTVLLFGPDPKTGGLAIHPWPITSKAPPTTQPVPFSVSYSFPDEAPGPRVIRAYQGVPAPATPKLWSSIPVRSVPVRVMLQPGQQPKDLYLR
jgi:type II secretory pathway pseudopilin PulG